MATNESNGPATTESESYTVSNGQQQTIAETPQNESWKQSESVTALGKSESQIQLNVAASARNTPDNELRAMTMPTPGSGGVLSPEKEKPAPGDQLQTAAETSGGEPSKQLIEVTAIMHPATQLHLDMVAWARDNQDQIAYAASLPPPISDDPYYPYEEITMPDYPNFFIEGNWEDPAMWVRHEFRGRTRWVNRVTAWVSYTVPHGWVEPDDDGSTYQHTKAKFVGRGDGGNSLEKDLEVDGTKQGPAPKHNADSANLTAGVTSLTIDDDFESQTDLNAPKSLA